MRKFFLLCLLFLCVLTCNYEGANKTENQEDQENIDLIAKTSLEKADSTFISENQNGNQISYEDAVKLELSKSFKEKFNADYNNYVTIEKIVDGNVDDSSDMPSKSIESPYFQSLYMSSPFGYYFMQYEWSRIITRTKTSTLVTCYAITKTVRRFTSYPFSYTTNSVPMIRAEFLLKNQTTYKTNYVWLKKTFKLNTQAVNYNWHEAFATAKFTFPGNVANAQLPVFKSGQFVITYITPLGDYRNFGSSFSVK